MNKIISLIKQGRLVVFSGAGISSESGIPTFRGKGGLWEEYDPNLYATIQGVKFLLFNAPRKIRNFIIDFYTLLTNSEPNYAHFALAQLEARGMLEGIITQNIDDFHIQAGSHLVAELHGNAYQFVCRSCKRKIKKTKHEVVDFANLLKKQFEKRAIVKTIIDFISKCDYCRKRLENGVVLFGQSLPEEEMLKAYQYIKNGKNMLCVGTTATVYPAVSFPYYAKKKGLKIININPEANEIDEISDFIIRSKAGVFFEKLMPFLGVL
ncbi:MAG: Sir2 family NAD-dependent protein deacetylase [Candidatus Omnitrophota bacterium]